MPRLADCIGLDVSHSSVQASQMVRFAYLLQVGLSRAEKLFAEHGSNCVYSRSGFAMPNTPRQIEQMLRCWGWCVAFDDDGTPYVIDRGGIKRKRRERTARAFARERAEIKRTEDEYRERKRLNRFFKDGQGQSHPKRGGKANSHDDIGKYNYNRGIRLSDTETRCAWRTYILR